MIAVPELKSNFYPEILDEITRHDLAIAEHCIQSAEAEAKSYLSKYDLATLFGGTLPDSAIGHLKTIVKDIASWHLVRLANPNIDLKLFRTNYEDGIKWLKSVQCGQTDPPDWPYPAATREDGNETAADGSQSVQWNSNRKRRPFF